MRLYDPSQGFGIVVNFVKQPISSSNIWLNLRFPDYLVSKDWIWSYSLGQTEVLFCGSILISFPDSCWKLSENWMKFNSMFSSSINIYVRKSGMQHFVYVTAAIAVDELDLVQYMQNEDLLQHFFLQSLCTFNSCQDIICSVCIDLLYHYLRL